MRRQNNGYFKLFSKNLFSMLLEIRKHFPKPFLTSAFLNDFCLIRRSYCDVVAALCDVIVIDCVV